MFLFLQLFNDFTLLFLFLILYSPLSQSRFPTFLSFSLTFFSPFPSDFVFFSSFSSSYLFFLLFFILFFNYSIISLYFSCSSYYIPFFPSLIILLFPPFPSFFSFSLLPLTSCSVFFSFFFSSYFFFFTFSFFFLHIFLPLSITNLFTSLIR